MTPNPAEKRAGELRVLLDAMDDDELVQAVAFGWWLALYRCKSDVARDQIAAAIVDFTRVQLEIERMARDG